MGPLLDGPHLSTSRHSHCPTRGPATFSLSSLLPGLLASVLHPTTQCLLSSNQRDTIILCLYSPQDSPLQWNKHTLPLRPCVV